MHQSFTKILSKHLAANKRLNFMFQQQSRNIPMMNPSPTEIVELFVFIEVTSIQYATAAQLFRNPWQTIFCLLAVFWAAELSRKFVFQICLPGGLEDKKIVFQICLPAEFCLPGISLNVQICLPDSSFTTLLQSCQRENKRRREK